MSNLLPYKWEAKYRGAYNPVFGLPSVIVSEAGNIQGMGMERISPPDTPPGQVEFIIRVDSDQKKDDFNALAGLTKLEEWEEITNEL